MHVSKILIKMLIQHLFFHSFKCIIVEIVAAKYFCGEKFPFRKLSFKLAFSITFLWHYLHPFLFAFLFDCQVIVLHLVGLDIVLAWIYCPLYLLCEKYKSRATLSVERHDAGLTAFIVSCCSISQFAIIGQRFAVTPW